MMKTLCRVIACVLLISIFVLSPGCKSEKKINVCVGMKLQEFRDVFSEDEYFRYGNYLFFKNGINEHCVAFVSKETDEIISLEGYPEDQIICTDENFARIEEGMTIEQVVSMVGIPQGSYTSGMLTLGFESASGKKYSIYLYPEVTELGMVYTVASVLPLDSE